MKNYALITTTLSALLFGLSPSHHAFAEDALAGTLPTAGAASAASAPAASSPAAAATATTPAASTATSTAPVFVPDAAPAASASTLATEPAATGSAAIVPVPPSSATLSGSTASTGGLTTSPAVPQVVQDAVNRLQKTDQINLDDMIRAQDAINRLDLLLEIEKRQTEIKKIRDERTKPAASSLLGSAIPASALNLPKLPASVASSSSADTPSSSSSPRSSLASTLFSSRSSSSGGPSEKYSIRRITGTDGHYVAVINTGDGSTQTAHVGDKLPDGSLVKSISLTSVSLFNNKKSKTLTIPTDSYIVRESGSSTE